MLCLIYKSHLSLFTDIYLDAVTNVRDIFPNRQQSDNLSYVIDFDLNELRNLTVQERRNTATLEQVYPLRFPSRSNVPFRLSTLNETIELLVGLNQATGRRHELLIEIKKPEYHTRKGKAISDRVLAVLNAYNLTRNTDPVIIQTFYIEELFYLRNILQTQLRLFALITSNQVNESSSNYEYYMSEMGIQNLSRIVQALAPDYQLVATFNSDSTISGQTNLTRLAHQYNLKVYPYTFRRDRFLGKSFEELIDYFWHSIKIDGFITDHPDVVLEYLQKTIVSTASTQMCHSVSFYLLTGFILHNLIQ